MPFIDRKHGVLRERPFRPYDLGFGLLLALALSAPFCHAAPDFTQSVINASTEEVIECDVVGFTIILRNSGDAPAGSAQLTLEWPIAGYLIETAGLTNPQIDYESGKVTAALSIAPGAEQQIRAEVLAPRDSGGDSLTLAVHLAHYDSGAELWDRKTIPVGIRLSQFSIPVGGLRIAPAALFVLGWLVAYVLACLGVYFLVGRPSTVDRLFGPAAAVTAIMIAIGFWMFFAAMAWRDYRVLTAWTGTTATIVGSRIVSETVSQSQIRTSGSGSGSGTSEVFKPEFALRYS
ncbi:MAG: hypothetical protein ABL994_17135, partial [Verrucomicrobiales bacterium]